MGSPVLILRAYRQGFGSRLSLNLIGTGKPAEQVSNEILIYR
jgi:hypothetical protein